MLIYVGLWPTVIKLNPSWKTEVSESAWIMQWSRFFGFNLGYNRWNIIVNIIHSVLWKPLDHGSVLPRRLYVFWLIADILVRVYLWHTYKSYHYLLGVILDLILRWFFADPEPPNFSILCGWSGMRGHFGLCSVRFSFVISSKLITFVCCKNIFYL